MTKVATTAGSTAEMRLAKNVTKYALREPGSYDFTTLVVESYGHQCTATHALLSLPFPSGAPRC